MTVTMKPEVILACLTLCLVEAGSSYKRRHSMTTPFGNHVRFPSAYLSALIKAETETSNHWFREHTPANIDQSASILLRSLTSGPQLPAHDVKPGSQRLNSNRFRLLQTILQQAMRQFIDTVKTSGMTSGMTKRQMTSPMGKRRYRCDFSRVSIQMILEYFRSRRVCGYRVNRMRFGLGGK